MRRFFFRRTSGSPCLEAAAGDERDSWCLLWARNNRKQMCAAHQHHVTFSRGADFGANHVIGVASAANNPKRYKVDHSSRPGKRTMIVALLSTLALTSVTTLPSSRSAISFAAGVLA